MSRAAGDGVEKDAPAHAVIVPFLDRLPMVARCVAGLLAYARPETRILLVDDGSTPPAESDPAIRALLADSRVTLLRHPENRGVAAARNTALTWCRAERVALVLMLDSDCEPSPDFIEGHLRLHAEHPDVAVFGCAVDGTGDTFWAHLDRVMTYVHAIGPAHEVRHPYHLGTTNFSVKLDRLPVREQVFDPRLNTGEDALLIRELRRNGETIRFSPTPRVIHHDRETWRGVLWHHYQYGQHQYFVQLGGDLAPRCFHPAYRVAFVIAFLPLLPLFALAGSVLNLVPWLRSHPAYVAWYPLMYALWAAKGFAVLESAVAPQRTLRLTPGEATAVAMPRIWRALAALALVAFGVVYFARALPLGLELTENGMILYPSWRVARGAVPYRDFVQLFGPSLYYANAAVFALAGPELLAVRWLVLALKIVILALAYLCARRVASTAWALACVVALGLVWGTPWWLFNTPYANHFALALCLAGVWLSLALPARLVVRSAAAGLCFGAAATFKQTSGLFALMALALALLIAPADEPAGGPRWLMGHAGRLVRWLALAASAALVVAYFAPGWTAWTLFALALPVTVLLAALVRREWQEPLDAPARAAGAAALLAAGAAAALPLLVYAVIFAADGALGAFLFNTARGLPDRVRWFVPFVLPPWQSWATVAAAISGFAALHAWRRGASWGAPAAVAVAGALVVAVAIAASPMPEAITFGAAVLMCPLIAWGGVVELVRRPPPSAAVARVAAFAVLSLLFFYPAGDPWHVLMMTPAFVPLLAHQGTRWMHVDAPTRSAAPLALAAALAAVFLIAPFLRIRGAELAAARDAAPAPAWAAGIVDGAPRFAGVRTVTDYLAQRPGQPLLVTTGDSLLYVLAGRDSSLAAEEFVLYLIGFDIIADDTARELLPEARVLGALDASHPTIVEAAANAARFRRVYPQAAAWIDAHYRPAANTPEYRVLEWAG